MQQISYHSIAMQQISYYTDVSHATCVVALEPVKKLLHIGFTRLGTLPTNHTQLPSILYNTVVCEGFCLPLLFTPSNLSTVLH